VGACARRLAIDGGEEKTLNESRLIALDLATRGRTGGICDLFS